MAHAATKHEISISTVVHLVKFFLKLLRGDEPAMICTGFPYRDAQFTKGASQHLFLNQLFVRVTSFLVTSIVFHTDNKSDFERK